MKALAEVLETAAKSGLTVSFTDGSNRCDPGYYKLGEVFGIFIKRGDQEFSCGMNYDGEESLEIRIERALDLFLLGPCEN